jgi:peptidoglycan/xylan/chitin deacetylase (PgdA/CDA1 family)
MSAVTASMPLGRKHDVVSRAARAITPFFRTKTARPRTPAPVVSFTFDDIPDSAADAGARVLEQHGARGTFYVAGGLCGRHFGDWKFANGPDIQALFARGHEIGCHSFSHPDLQQLGEAEVAQDLDRNADFLRDLPPGLTPKSFAYPYGSVAIPQKRLVQKRFRSARGVRQGINRGTLDLGQLLAVRLYDVLLDGAALDQLVAEAAAAKGWLIFYTHDVAASPTEHGCSPHLLDLALRAAQRHGCAVRTVDGALDLLSV